MAFIVNANFFRLGYNKRWPSSWYKKSSYKDYLHRDFIIYKFIKIFFLQYTTPTFTYKFLRYPPLPEGERDERSGNFFIRFNPFIYSNFLFDFLNINRSSVLTLRIYILDNQYETWRRRFTRTTRINSTSLFNPRQQYLYDLILSKRFLQIHSKRLQPNKRSRIKLLINRSKLSTTLKHLTKKWVHFFPKTIF